MTTPTPTPTPSAITPEQFAAHLRWLLGNHNFEVEDLDAASDAYDTEGNPLQIEVNVSTINLATRVGGSQRFTVTVAEVVDPPKRAELPGRADPDAEVQLHDPDADVW